MKLLLQGCTATGQTAIGARALVRILQMEAVAIAHSRTSNNLIQPRLKDMEVKMTHTGLKTMAIHIWTTEATTQVMMVQIPA